MVNYNQLVEGTRKAFNSGRTRSLQWRLTQLRALNRFFVEKRSDILTALYRDLRKHKAESQVMEVTFVQNDIADMLNNLEDWLKPKEVQKDPANRMDSCYIQYQPLGVCLIISAWNYPIQLTLGPLVGAIAGGNCVILKPSELAEHTAELLEKFLPQYMDKDCIHVVNGGVPETQALLEERYDHIMYTGNNQVAKIIYQAAAKHLTPVVLELGGKSPCYVDPNSDLDLVARRVTWGRFTNTGQTCIAPDYVMCTPEVQDKLVEKMRTHLKAFYGDNPQKSDSYGRIINNRHFNRLKDLLSSGRCVIGGEVDEKDNYIAPTVLADVKATDPAMIGEIFGPILPIYTVKNIDEAIGFINSREKPLAAYVFSKDKKVVQRFLSETTSGGVTANDCLLHAGLFTLPFGGVGMSGMGHYHGKFSLDTFTHHRAVMIKKQSLEVVNNLRVPPYTDRKLGIIQWAMSRKEKRKGGIMSYLPLVVIGVIIAFILKALGFGREAAPPSLK